MTADIIPLNAAPLPIGQLAASVTRKVALRILRRQEQQMMLTLDEAMRLETRVEELADDHPEMLRAAQNNYTRAVTECGSAMREVRLMRLSLGMEPHPMCAAAGVAMGVK